jgi:hypothetical protein
MGAYSLVNPPIPTLKPPLRAAFFIRLETADFPVNLAEW